MFSVRTSKERVWPLNEEDEEEEELHFSSLRSGVKRRNKWGMFNLDATSVCLPTKKKKIIIGDLRSNKDHKNAEIKENQFPSVPKFGAKELIFEHIYDIFLFCSGGHTWQINHFEQNKHKNVPDRFLAARVM